MSSSGCMTLHAQLASVMEVLANAAVAEICKLVDDGYSVLRLEISESRKEICTLRRKLKMKALRKRPCVQPPAKSMCGESGLNEQKIGPDFEDVRKISNDSCTRHGDSLPADNVATQDDPQWHNQHLGNGSQITFGSLNKTETMRDIEHLIKNFGEDVGDSYGNLFERTTSTVEDREELLDPCGTHSSNRGDQTALKTETDGADSIATLPEQQWTREEEDRVGLDCHPWNGINQSETSSSTSKEIDPTESFSHPSHTLDSLGITVCQRERDGRSPPDWKPDSVVKSPSIKVERDMCVDGTVMDLNVIPVDADPVNIDRTDKSRGDMLSSKSGVTQFCSLLPTAGCRTDLGSRSDAPHCEALPGNNMSFSTKTAFPFVQPRRASFPKKTGDGKVPASFHSAKMTLRCSLCGRLFSQMTSLKRHERVHTGEKPFFCMQCGKRFSHRHQLKNHERIHTGEKPFCCRFCGRCFTQSNHMRRHLNVHLEEMPLRCMV